MSHYDAIKDRVIERFSQGNDYEYLEQVCEQVIRAYLADQEVVAEHLAELVRHFPYPTHADDMEYELDGTDVWLTWTDAAVVLTQPLMLAEIWAEHPNLHYENARRQSRTMDSCLEMGWSAEDVMQTDVRIEHIKEKFMKEALVRRSRANVELTS